MLNTSRTIEAAIDQFTQDLRPALSDAGAALFSG
jgi:hypothetical protein